MNDPDFDRWPDTKVKGFTKAVKPAVEWLRKNAHPHCSIIITQTEAELLQGELTYIHKEKKNGR